MKEHTLRSWQQAVDQWISTYGVRYFDVPTNTMLLMEEVGEFSSLLARVFGEQSFRDHVSEQEKHDRMKDELGDVFFVLTCLANQLGIDLQDALSANLKKKSNRDSDRHQLNPKLQI